MHMLRQTGILLLCLAAIAQAQNGKSPVSRYGIGELHPFTSAFERGMGSVATANASRHAISQTNPALWSQLSEIRLYGDLVFENESFDMNNQSFSYATARIKSLQLAFPVSDEYGIRLVGGVVPYSRTDYKVEGTAAEAGENYTVVYAGSGGLSMFRIGASVKPVSSVYLGIAYQYYFGTIDQNWEIDYANPMFYDTKEVRSTSHTGSGVLAGLYYTGFKNMSLGFSISPAAALDAKRNFTYQYSLGDSTMEGAKGTQDVPLSFTAGATWKFTPEWRVGVEYAQQDWADASVFDQKQSQLDKAYKYGIGFEWTPGLESSDNEDYWKQLAVRFGFYNAQGYIHIDDEFRKESVFSAGFGFPVIGTNRADLALEYGWNGASDQPAGQRTFLRLSLSISAGETWYKRRSAYDE